MEGLVARSEKIGPTKGVSAPISSYHPAGGSVARNFSHIKWADEGRAAEALVV